MRKLINLILKSGYPSGLGCGPTSIKYNNDIVDTFGNRLIYEYKSSNSVKFYFDKADESELEVYELLNNNLTEK